MRKGAAGSGLKPPTTLAERKAALLHNGFSLMRLTTPKPTNSAERKSPAASEADLDLGSASPRTPLDHHALKGRVKPAGQRRAASRLSPFRPPTASPASTGSWDD